jgi:hypothetical protein
LSFAEDKQAALDALDRATDALNEGWNLLNALEPDEEEEPMATMTITNVDRDSAEGTYQWEQNPDRVRVRLYTPPTATSPTYTYFDEDVAGSSGSWSVTYPPLPDGSYRCLVHLLRTDGSGSTSATQDFTLTTAPPPTGDYSRENQPPVSWKLYSDDSRFNTPLRERHPNGIPVAANSATMVANTFNGSPQLSNAVNQNWSIPIYYSRGSDPLYRLNITNFQAKNYVQDLPDSIRLPAGASPSLSASGDQNIWVYDQTDGFIYHFRLGPDGGINHSTKVITGWRCFRLEAEGSGFRFPNEPVPRAAPIRPEELLEPGGDIGHVISFNCSCVGEGPVGWYAESDSVGRNICGKADSALVHFGHVLYLDRTDAQIEALSIPGWGKNLLRGLAHYGCIVERNSGSPQADGSDWYLQFENQLDRAGNPYTGAISLPLGYSTLINYKQYMKVIAP